MCRERYPMTSQLIEENKIPEFDNLYVDFNGIIHNCSHPNDNDAHFRLSEQQIFTSIFSYVDMLFGKVKPKKLFFMAVDGVAPRAKMNQQRSRRFRTAKEAKEIKEKAEKNGEKLPDEKAFDSNCITPGTSFMARLSEQLRYFVNKKITEDANWRNIEVVLSGHDVPGEGEHKIMEYIRLSKAQSDYNPNVRHCLYGLDADLIMLGLLSHDPHFCLLREEVKFGPAVESARRIRSTLESINFYLLHLSLMREYLNLEFHDIEPSLPFAYSLEHVIDDFILLAVFVGNDFLPNLPDLHIHENGLERLFEVYKKVLPSMGGYLNESGVIDTRRLQLVLDEMNIWEREVFEKEYGDMNWYKGKQAKHVKEMEGARRRNKLVLTQPQRIIFEEVRTFVLSHRKAHGVSSMEPTPDELTMPNTFPARERVFITDLAGELHLELSWDKYDDEDQNLVIFRLPGSARRIENGRENGKREDKSIVENGTGEIVGQGDDEDGQWVDASDASDDSEEPEAQAAVDRVLQKYERAKVVEEEEEDFDARHARAVQERMDEWKRGYYSEKLEISYNDPKEMNQLVYRYVEGLQWVMHYYYSGVASWSWFYDYHYAPRISDLKGVDRMQFHFDLGRPFRPFEQLMGVLPAASMDHIPEAYRELMTDSNSPILDFYPLEFEQDLNGKKQEWEAVVKIPFIDQNRLLKAMASREHRLTEEERKRNSYGTSTLFKYNSGEPTFYPSSLPGFFPALTRCACTMEPFNLPTLDGLHLVPGLCDGVFLGAEALAGFPTLETLPHTAQLGYHGVNVHGSESKNKSMVVHVQNPYEGAKTEKTASEMVGRRAFVGWPFVREAMVIGVSDQLFKYEKLKFGDGRESRVLGNPHTPQGINFWKAKADKIEHYYSKRLGVITGSIEVLLHVRPLKGLKRLDTGALVKEYEGQEKEFEQALQMVLPEVISEDPRFLEKNAPPLAEEFPSGAKVFFLGDPGYGVAAQVSETTEKSLSVTLAFFPNEKVEIEKFKAIVSNRLGAKYFPSYTVAEMIGISGHALSKITASFMVLTADGQKNNLGLSLKFEAKSLKVIGYSRKNGRFWEFSEKAVQLIREYKQAFPEVFLRLGGNGDQMARSSDVFPVEKPDLKVREVKSWLSGKGVRDLEAVSLFCDQLDKESVSQIVGLADECTQNKSATSIKKAMVKGIPRQAILKPAHAVYRLQNQTFALGDRVIMVQDSGSVPLAVKGVVVGINAKSLDIAWDVPFMAGTTLGDRCPMYRGSTVDFNACLNLTRPQFIVSTNPNAPPAQQNIGPRQQQQRIGSYPAVQPAPGQAPAAGFHPATSRGGPPMRIMTNPNRGRGGGGRGGVPHVNGQTRVNGNADHANDIVNGAGQQRHSDAAHGSNEDATTANANPPATRQLRGGFRGGHGHRGAAPYQPPTPLSHTFGPPPRGFANPRARGGFDRGRGGPMGVSRGGFRGRGRGGSPLPSPNGQAS
ncbi:exonuclease II [Phellopilus nigrolimitatus]|nr:exonuclease II [Phellopilus nigrolimitatus]